MDLENKSAIVTGSASGIGREVVLTLAANGASVTVADRNLQGAETVVRQILEAGGTARAVEVDVTDRGRVASMVEATVAASGSLDIFVNVAGFGFNSRIVDMAEDDWDRVLDVNLKGQFLCCQAAGRQMMQQGKGGRIVNIASTAANNARYEGGAYCAAKAGVVQLTRVLALELGEFGITVNAVGPGFTETPATVESSDEYRTNFLAQVPAGRSGRTSDIANTVLFLASPQAEYINGQVIYVDGGYSAGKLSVRG
jgi:NAD(P)-dependent dehydrogenase (short-subunit alcohol dehydrogenase family)